MKPLFPLFAFALVIFSFIGQASFPAQAQQVPALGDDDALEEPLEQPADPANVDLQPDALPAENGLEAEPGVDVVPAENAANAENAEVGENAASSDQGQQEEAKPEEEADDGVIKFDPNKAVVKPAKVVEEKPVTLRGVPAPKHSANPEADLFEHAVLVAKYELWPEAERQYQLYIENYPGGPNAQAAFYGLAEARLKLGRLDEAEATYRALLARFRGGEHVGAAAYRLANIHYQREEYQEAVGHFEIATRTATKDLVRKSASFFHARCLQNLGAVRQSEAIYERLSADLEDHPYRAASTIILARMNVDRGRHQEAYDAFAKLAEPPTAPNIRAEAMTKAGLMAAKLGLPEEAQAYYENILNLDTEDVRPWHPKAFWGLLHLYYEQGNYQDLIDQYQSRRISYSEDTQGSLGQMPVMLMVAHAFRRLEKYRQAASLYDQIVRLDPTGPEAKEAGYRHLYCLYKDGSPFLSSKMEDYLKRQRLQGKDHPYYHLALLLKAESLFNRAQKSEEVYAEAAQTYDAIDLEMIPEKHRGMVTYKLAWAYCEAGAYESGTKAFYTFLDQYAEEHPELVPKVLAKRGEAFRTAKNYPAALKDFDKLIATSGDEKLIYLAMQQKALIHVERENHQGTITAFQELLDKFPDGVGTSEAYFFIGDAHYKLGNFEAAIDPLTKARELDAETYTTPGTQRILVAHWRLSNLESAVKEVEILLGEDPKTNLIPPKLWLWLGTRSFQQDEYEAAARYLKQVATPSAPKDTWPLAWSFLGRAYLESGNYEESIVPFDHYLATDPGPEERAKALLDKATALSKVGRLEEAQAAAEEVQHLQKQGRTYGQAWILLGDIAMAREDFEKASKYYVIPSRMFKDPLVTPVALERAANAFDKMGEAQRAADLRRQLDDDWPAHETASVTTDS